VALTIGVAWGAIAGFLRHNDELMMRFVDVSTLSIHFLRYRARHLIIRGPDAALMLIFMLLRGGMASTWRASCAGRRSRSGARSSSKPHALPARGAGDVFRHMAPNSPAGDRFARSYPVVILTRASFFPWPRRREPLTSLGALDRPRRGADPGAVALGHALRADADHLARAQFFGDGLRDALDPKSASHADPPQRWLTGAAGVAGATSLSACANSKVIARQGPSLA